MKSTKSSEEQRMAEKKRMANLELLRCVAMMMVVVLHYLAKGELLPSYTVKSLGTVGIAAWSLEALCIVAVNVYMLISGYFLCESSFKPRRLIGLWLQLEFYSVVIGLVGAFTGVVSHVDVDTHYYLNLLFPVSMGHYWFMTAYLYLYLLLPLVGYAVKKMTKEQHIFVMGSLLALFCGLKSILPVRLDMDQKGYDHLWYLVVFLVAAYIRKYGFTFLEKKRNALLLYLGSAVCIVAEVLILRYIYAKTGSLELIQAIPIEYNHIFAFTASLGLFGLFQGIQIKDGAFSRLICKIAPLTLGVYLLHENLGLRYSWQNWFHADRVESAFSLLLWTMLAVICVFLCGIAVEAIRSLLFTKTDAALVHIPLYRKWKEWLKEKDDLFRVKE